MSSLPPLPSGLPARPHSTAVAVPVPPSIPFRLKKPEESKANYEKYRQEETDRRAAATEKRAALHIANRSQPSLNPNTKCSLPPRPDPNKSDSSPMDGKPEHKRVPDFSRIEEPDV